MDHALSDRLEEGEILEDDASTPAEHVMDFAAADRRCGPDGTLPADDDGDAAREARAPGRDGFGEVDDEGAPPSSGFFADMTWDELVDFINSDPSSVSLHSGLSFEAVSVELEARLQAMADDGDELLMYVRLMASKVKMMPMAPVLAMMLDAADKVLRARRFNVSTSVDGQDNTPVRL